MKINKQLLTQIIKEELQNVLERKVTQDELDAMGTLAGAPDPGDIKNLSPEKRAQLDQMGTLAGAPDPGDSAKPTPEQQAQLDQMGTLAGAPDPGDSAKPTPEQQAQLDQMGTLAPQQDVEQMATKYAKVKQVLAKLVKEL